VLHDLGIDAGSLLLARVTGHRDQKANRRAKAIFERRTRVNSHVKDEPYPEPKPCRLINARDDWAKCQLGPVFSAIEHTVCQLPWFIKYIPVSDRPGAVMDRVFMEGARYVCTDYTSFEAHFTNEMMWALEEPLYRIMVENLPWDVKTTFLKMWKVAVTGDNLIDFTNLFLAKLKAVRMSGEMNTSLGNGWSNLVLFLFAMDEKGATWDEIIDSHGFVEGDDGIFRIDERISPTSAQMESYGFRLKIDVVSDIKTASFCGLIFDPDDLVAVTDPLLVLMKLAWLPRRYIGCRGGTADELLKAKAQSALYQYNGCPIITTACVRILEQLKDVAYTARTYNSFDSYKLVIFKESFGVVARDIPDNTRALVEQMYGISLTMQSVIESALSQYVLGEELHLTFPSEYDHYSQCYEDYVSFPTEPDPVARSRYYQFLQKLYMSDGGKLPQPPP